MIISQQDIELAESYRSREIPPKFMAIELQAIWNRYRPDDQKLPQECFCGGDRRIAFHAEFFRWFDETLQQSND